jgi:hypothetical protein
MKINILKRYGRKFVLHTLRKLIGAEGARLRRGIAGKLRPHRAKPEEAQLTPRGKRAPAAEINHYSLL